MKRSIAAAAAVILLFAGQTHAATKADQVRIDKSERLLLLYNDGVLVKSFRISLGPVPVGDKVMADDGRTPEGRFLIEAMEPTRFYKAVRASHPGKRLPADAAGVDARAGAVPASPVVVIHGQRPALELLSPIMKRLDWTDGSIAMSNHDLDEFLKAIGPGTPLAVEP